MEILNKEVILEGLVYRRPACCESGGCCFECVSGLCPFGYDVVEDCFPHMTTFQKQLFITLFELRICALKRCKNQSDH